MVACCGATNSHTHTHTHIYIYIYIYILNTTNQMLCFQSISLMFHLFWLKMNRSLMKNRIKVIVLLYSFFEA